MVVKNKYPKNGKLLYKSSIIGFQTQRENFLDLLKILTLN
jgi:hypothetical protein